MSTINVMNLSIKELFNQLSVCEDSIESQKKSLCDFRDIILSSPNKFRKENIGILYSKIFVGGAGRSGLVAKSFAMRLRQLGFNSYVFGESIVPEIKNGDIVITISNSGKSNSITQMVEELNLDDVKLLSVCGNRTSELAKKSDSRIVIESKDSNILTSEDRTCLEKLEVNPDELVLLGTAFETSSLIILDALIVELMQALGLNESVLKDMHDNLSSYIN